MNIIRRAVLVAVASAALIPAACGSDAKSGTKLDTNRQIVVDYSIADAAKVGYDLDRDCLAKLALQLSDADAALLAESTKNTSPDATTPELSDAGESIGNMVLDCAKGSTNQALIGKAVDAVLAQSGSEALDRSCVEKNFAHLNDEQLQLIIDAGPDSTDPKLQAAAFALFDCLDFGTDTSTATS